MACHLPERTLPEDVTHGACSSRQVWTGQTGVSTSPRACTDRRLDSARDYDEPISSREVSVESVFLHGGLFWPGRQITTTSCLIYIVGDQPVRVFIFHSLNCKVEGKLLAGSGHFPNSADGNAFRHSVWLRWLNCQLSSAR